MTSPTDTTITRKSRKATGRSRSEGSYDASDRVEADLDVRPSTQQTADQELDFDVPLIPLPFFTTSGHYTYSRRINLPITPVPLPIERPLPDPSAARRRPRRSMTKTSTPSLSTSARR